MRRSMKEIPMLFSTPMVQALVAGRKTMTRRLVKMPKDDIADAKWGYTSFTPPGHISFRGVHSNGQYGESFVKVPYSKGDLFWVRETWAPYLRGTDGDGFVELIKYKADGAEIAFKHVKDYAELGWHNRPGIHMNKEYARIWLQVTDVRVERLQDISQEDAQAEGMTQAPHRCPGWKNSLHDFKDCFICPFKVLWNQINGENGHQWDKNEWVWVISFKGLSSTGKPALLTETTNNE